MATQTTIRENARKDLHDEDSNNYRWTDATLNRHIQRAVKEISFHVPREIRSTVATTNASRDVTLNTTSPFTLFLEIAAVEYPVGNFPPTYVRFSLWGTTLTLLGEDIPNGGNCYVYWYQEHTVDASSLPPFQIGARTSAPWERPPWPPSSGRTTPLTG